MIAQTIENATVVEQPETLRIIRNGQWAYVQPDELTEAELRAIYVAAFSVYE